MKILLLISTFLFTLSTQTFAQSNSMDSEANKLLFNIFSHNNIDSTILPFIKRHFPYLLESKDSIKWTISPFDSTESVKTYNCIYTLKFDSHPYFKSNYFEGQLIIYAEEAPGYSPRITGREICFLYKTKDAALIAYKMLIAKFSKYSQSKRASIYDNVTVTELSTQKKLTYVNSIFVSLSKLDNSEIGYKVTFRQGTYNHEY